MLAAIRQIIRLSDQSLEGRIEAQASTQVEILTEPDLAEGRAAFLEHRRRNSSEPDRGCVASTN